MNQPYNTNHQLLDYLPDLNIIKEWKRLVERLRLSEERFSKAFNASPNPVVISTIGAGKIIDVNYNFLKFFGYSRKEV